MNGIISKPATRSFATRPQLRTTLLLGGCLFSGFVSGMTAKPQSFTRFSLLHPLRTETVSVDPVAWIAKAGTQNFKTAQAEAIRNDVESEPEFQPFQLKPTVPKAIASAFRPHPVSNFRKLESNFAYAAKVIRNSQVDRYNDFVIAAQTLQKVLTPQAPTEAVTTTMASAESAAQSVVMAAPRIILHRAPVIASRTPAVVKAAAPAVIDAIIPDSDEVKSVQIAQGLTDAQKKQLTDAMLTASVDKASSKKIALNDSQKRFAKHAENRQSYAERVTHMTSDPEQGAAMDEAGKTVDEMIDKAVSKTAGSGLVWKVVPDDQQLLCKTLSTHSFIRPGDKKESEKSDTCPQKVEWISKTRNDQGWVRIEMPESIPTLTLHPAPNDGSTLLLNANSLAMLSLKTGTHITKGMGVILGLAPDEYKIEFAGRGEDVEYFDSNGHHYFVILNAEPGAGILNLESKTNPALNSAVFTPVVENTITYLDLAKPEQRTLQIQVVKTGKANDADVNHLTVGLSTQAGIQGITQANGVAILRNINLVHGFPVYIDVSSKNNNTNSYSYRFQLKRQAANGNYVVNEIEEKSIAKWLAQVKSGLSDQSAMVVALFDRKKLNGFQIDHQARVESLTAKYGLDPLNYSVLWDGQISESEPLEGDLPRFMAVQVPEGLSRVDLLKSIGSAKQIVLSDLFPISPRVIHVISE